MEIQCRNRDTMTRSVDLEPRRSARHMAENLVKRMEHIVRIEFAMKIIMAAMVMVAAGDTKTSKK